MAVALFAMAPVPLARAQRVAAPSGDVESGEPTTAEAPEVIAARVLFEEGAALAAAERWEEAIERFTRSDAMAPRPSTTFNLGACLYALGRHVEAVAAFERYVATADPVVDADGLRDVVPILAHSRGSIARLTIDVEPPDARAELDGQPIEGAATRVVLVDPGTHALRVEADGRVAVLREVPLGPGQRAREVVALAEIAVDPVLEIRSTAGAAIEVDGAPAGTSEVTLTLPPGVHAVGATLAGHDAWSRTVTLTVGEHVMLEAGLSRTPDAWWQSPWPWLAMGALAAGAGIGAGFGIDAAVHAGGAPAGGTTAIVLVDLDVPGG